MFQMRKLKTSNVNEGVSMYIIVHLRIVHYTAPDIYFLARTCRASPSLKPSVYASASAYASLSLALAAEGACPHFL